MDVLSRAAVGSLLLTVLIFTSPRTAAATLGCGAIEHVYSQSASVVTEHRYCAGGLSGFLAPKVIATFGESPPQLFWGGLRDNGAAVFYGVTPDGELHWIAQSADTGQLEAGVQIGGAFGDWRRFETLLATGEGYLYTVDATGHLLQFMHYGWQDGTDGWSGEPADLGVVCPGSRPVYASTAAALRYVGVRSSPPSYEYCPADQVPVTASRLPDSVRPDSVTAAVRAGVSFALDAASGRLVRMVLEDGPQPQWRVDAVDRVVDGRVFVGRATFLSWPQEKYEWQFSFYC